MKTSTPSTRGETTNSSSANKAVSRRPRTSLCLEVSANLQEAILISLQLIGSIKHISFANKLLSLQTISSRIYEFFCVYPFSGSLTTPLRNWISKEGQGFSINKGTFKFAVPIELHPFQKSMTTNTWTFTTPRKLWHTKLTLSYLTIEVSRRKYQRASSPLLLADSLVSQQNNTQKE